MGSVIHASRAALLKEILDTPTASHLIVGPFGIGKTAFLNELGTQLFASGVVVMRLSVPKSAEATDPAARSLHTFRQCLDIARQFGDQLGHQGEPRLLRNITGLTRRAQFNPISINQSISASDHASVQADHAQSVHFHWGDYLATLDGLLCDEIATAVGSRTRKVKLAILIEDVHNLDGLHSGAWMAELLRRIDGAWVIATRRPGDDAGVLSPAFTQHELGPLSTGDVVAQLERCFGKPPSPTLVELTCTATGRLPWAVDFLTARMAGAPALTQHELRDLLERTDIRADLSGLVDVCLVHLPGALRAGLESLSILRDFDNRVAAYMLAELSLAETSDKFLQQLSQAHLLDISVTAGEDPARSSDPARPQSCMHIPSIIRTAVCKRGSQQNSLYIAGRHCRAAHFYRTAVDELSATLADPFSHWAATEGGISQRYLSEWVYHVANGTQRLSAADRDKILRWYLEGFFWYDWKVPHWFCQRLLEYCDEFRRAGASVDWIDCLQSLHKHYPRGWQKNADPTTWRVVANALIQLRAYVRQPGGPPAAATDGSQVYALATYLLAQSYYFSGLHLELAAERYIEAARWFVGEENAWCRTYVLLQQADLAVRLGDPDTASASYATLLAAAKQSEDIEMFCHTLLMRADERWQSGAVAEAIAADLQAVLHAMAYQVRQLFLPEMVNFPDAYTREVYAEAVSRATAHLDALEVADAALASGARRAIARIFAAFWEYDGALPASLFPPGPGDDDLGRSESEYVSRVRWLVEQWDSLLWNLDIRPEAIGLARS
jgi:hypothetical protein